MPRKKDTTPREACHGSTSRQTVSFIRCPPPSNEMQIEFQVVLSLCSFSLSLSLRSMCVCLGAVVGRVFNKEL